MARSPDGVVEWPEREVAFQALVGGRLDRAYGLALHIVGNAGDADDACQEALLAAWSAWPRLRDPGRFDAWFDRILVNTCLEHLRRRRRRPQAMLSEEPDVADRDVLAGTVERDAMAFWADLPTEAIAERLGIPPGTVRSRLHYALDALRTFLGQESPQ